MLAFTLFVWLAFVGSSVSLKQGDALEEFQAVWLQFQLEAEALKFKPEGSVVKSSLPEVGLAIEELIGYYGFPSETYEVVAEDGYILTLHRIPHGLDNANATDRPAVLLMPGLFCSAGFYLASGKESSLGFWLANQGYDVWIANYRGTTHSRKHLSLNADSEKSSYWDYSFDEIGYYDIPAFIDHILAATNQEKVFYIGHSQGTSAFFAMAAQRPEYNEKIRLMVALAPIAFISHTTHPVLKVLVQNKDILYLLATTLNFYEIFPHWDFITTWGNELCNDDADTQDLCVALLGAVAGVNEKEMNKTLIPLILSHVPSGASIKQLMHYGQEILSGYFRKYDYGIVGNLVKYGKTTPPDFEIESITAPVALFYSQNDLFAHIDDVTLLLEKLPNLATAHLVEDEEFTHLDFGIAVNVVTLVYEKVLNLMKEY